MKNNNRPMFSIIIPVYNGEKYIKKCVDSIISQSEKDYEIIIVNDGSSDHTKTLAEELKLRYPKQIKLINQNNEGLYKARRNGAKQAKGQFLWFVDSDDYVIGKDSLKAIKEAIRKTSCDYIFFNATSKAGTKEKLFKYPYDNLETFEKERKNIILKLFLDTKEFCHIWNNIFKKELFDWKYDEESLATRMLRDGPFQMIPLLKNAKKICHLDLVAYYYTDDNLSSLSHNFKPDFFQSVIDLHKRIEQIYQRWDYKTEELQKLSTKSFMYDISICAIKTRNINKNSKIKRLDYLKSIGQNEYFRKRYSLEGLSKHRKIICWALYHHMYILINSISSTVGVAKKIINNRNSH